MLALLALLAAPVMAAQQRRADPAAAAANKKIVFAEHPAILVVIDGDPVYRPMKGTELQRIVNTRPFIVRDRADIHYLKVLDGWMQAYGLRGLWSVAGVPPPGAEDVLRRIADPARVDRLSWITAPDTRPHLDDATAPTVFISTTPADLIVMNGPPQYATVAGTALEYVENTSANIFKEPTDDELYVLIGRQWFRAWTIDGPWQLVPRSELPADIAAIPDDSAVWHRPAQRHATAPRQ
jgi:hypothetical protein